MSFRRQEATEFMPNFREQILEQANGEPILGIVVSTTISPLWLSPKQEPVQTWEEVEDTLDYEYNNGYGAVGSHAITAWTQSWVIFVEVYDGASSVVRVPRNPIQHIPEYIGGW